MSFSLIVILISHRVDLKQWPGGSTFMHNSTTVNLRGWRFGALV